MNRAYASPEHDAPKLLGCIPSYNTTLFAHKKRRASHAKRVTDAGPSSEAPSALRPLRGQLHLPIDRVTPDPFSKSSKEMPFHPANLEDDDTTPGDVSLVAASGGKRPSLSLRAKNVLDPRWVEEARGRGLAHHPTQSSPPEHLPLRTKLQPRIQCGIWRCPTLGSRSARRGQSVGDDPKVAYALLNRTLLPRDAQELPKDLETALGSACQLHIQVLN